jgi:hypothetical protein
VFGGYRTIEGGANVDTVHTFATTPTEAVYSRRNRRALLIP